jgi:nucleoside-diphosphate-sugar epimerase
MTAVPVGQMPKLNSYSACRSPACAVYGSWGRPDMAIFLFTKAIIEGRPIKLFNHGRMRRDFTYIDDACRTVLRLIDHVPAAGPTAPARIYNIGNQHPEELVEVVALLEKQLGRICCRCSPETFRRLLPISATSCAIPA